MSQISGSSRELLSVYCKTTVLSAQQKKKTLVSVLRGTFWKQFFFSLGTYGGEVTEIHKECCAVSG